MTTTSESPPTDSPPTGTPRTIRGLGRPLLIALVIALLGGGVLAVAGQQREASPAANRALVDSQATGKVVGDVSNALVKIFSYAPGDTAATEKAAAEVLEGKAAEQYRTLFPQVKREAPAQQLGLATRVVRAGVRELDGDTTRLLVFLDQASTRKGAPAGGTAAAQLAVTARLRDGQWRITEIRSS